MNAVLSSMQASEWYDHFRGALYPIDLEECLIGPKKTNQVKTLCQLAADMIVMDSTSTAQAINILPQELSLILMQQALEGNKDRAVDVLLTKWPHPLLSLKKFAPNIFTSLSLLHDHEQLTRVAKQGMRYTTCIAHNFMETLKKKDPTKLKFLDMSGYPTAEVITYYLATHCMLAHNEARQNMMIRKYEAAIKLLPEMGDTKSLERFKEDHSLPEDTAFAVKFDAFLTSENAMSEMCKALKVSSFKDSCLKLFVEKLDVTCLGEQKLTILMEQMNKEHVKGLRLKYNSLSGEDFINLSPLMSTFTNITALDISCNCINIYQNDAACDAMGDLFYKLPNLVRLDLSNNRLKSKLRRVLSRVQKPLQYLRVSGCGLQVSDMTYLSMSHHVVGLQDHWAGLQELDISENGWGNCLGILIHLLANIKTNIHVLEIQEAGFNEAGFESLMNSLPFRQMSSLLYLNISGYSLSIDVLFNLGSVIARYMPKLQYIYVSYPRECYSDMMEELQDIAKRSFATTFGHVISTEMANVGIQKPVPNVVLSELEHGLGT